MCPLLAAGDGPEAGKLLEWNGGRNEADAVHIDWFRTQKRRWVGEPEHGVGEAGNGSIHRSGKAHWSLVSKLKTSAGFNADSVALKPNKTRH